MRIALPLLANNLPSNVLYRSGYMPTFGKPFNMTLTGVGITNSTNLTFNVFGTNHPTEALNPNGGGSNPTVNDAVLATQALNAAWVSGGAKNSWVIDGDSVGSAVNYAYVYFEIYNPSSTASGVLHVGAGGALSQ